MAITPTSTGVTQSQIQNRITVTQLNNIKSLLSAELARRNTTMAVNLQSTYDKSFSYTPERTYTTVSGINYQSASAPKNII